MQEIISAISKSILTNHTKEQKQHDLNETSNIFFKLKET